MCNSGSSAINLAWDLLGLPEGSEVITPALTFSTDVSALLRARLVPAFIDVEPNSYNAVLDQLDEMVGQATRAVFIPNLIGSFPDWDVIRSFTDRHGLLVIEDSCDAFAPVLRGRNTSDRADLSVTSFALAHAITCAGTGGMVLTDDDDLWRRGQKVRRWGRRSETFLFGDTGQRRSFRGDLDGIPYNDDMIYDELSWNLEPSEFGAAFGRVQLKRIDAFDRTRRANFARYQERFASWPEHFVPPAELPGTAPIWMAFPAGIAASAPFERADLQEYLDERGIVSRTVWSGNITRHPMMRGREFRTPLGGLPNTDEVMKRHFMLPCHQGMTLADVDRVCNEIEAFLAEVAR
jgi:CDP-6-deoxy-D-xylo-4-hexulose-3-dehydrase